MPYWWTTWITTETGAMTMARMFNPPHPGLTLRDDVLPALGLTVTQAAQQLNVSRAWHCPACSTAALPSRLKWRCASRHGWA